MIPVTESGDARQHRPHLLGIPYPFWLAEVASRCGGPAEAGFGTMGRIYVHSRQDIASFSIAAVG